MYVLEIIFRSLINIGFSIGIIFLFVIVPLSFLCRKARVVRRFKRVQRAAAKKESQESQISSVAKGTAA